MERSYPSDLTDAEWKRIEPIFDRFRFDRHDPRELLNAVFYLTLCFTCSKAVVSGGCSRRRFPLGGPPTTISESGVG